MIGPYFGSWSSEFGRSGLWCDLWVESFEGRSRDAEKAWESSGAGRGNPVYISEGGKGKGQCGVIGTTGSLCQAVVEVSILSQACSGGVPAGPSGVNHSSTINSGESQSGPSQDLVLVGPH